MRLTEEKVRHWWIEIVRTVCYSECCYMHCLMKTSIYCNFQPKLKLYINHQKVTQGRPPLQKKRGEGFIFPFSEVNQLKSLWRKGSILEPSLPLLLFELILHWQLALIMFWGFTKNDTSDHSNSVQPLKLSTAEESPQLGTPTSKPVLCSPQYICVATISINGSCGSPQLSKYL